MASPIWNSKSKEVRFLVVEREGSNKAFIVSPGSFLVVGDESVRSYLPSMNKLFCWGPIGELASGNTLETELKALLTNFDREKSLGRALADARSSPDYRYFVPRYFFAPDEEPGGSGVEPRVVLAKIVSGELELTLENPATRRMATLYIDVSKNIVTRSIVGGKPYTKRKE